ncbi:MAG: cation diffusion facilitator family transporter, partial [Brevundimonas sp.]
GAYLGAPGLDAAAGLVVAVWLFWGATGMLKAAADHLLDRAVPESDRNMITQAVLSDARISGVHQLRTRMAGQVMMVQMHVDLDPAPAIVVEAEIRVLSHYPTADILIHADPRGRVRPPVGVPAETTEPPPAASAASESTIDAEPHAAAPTTAPPKGPWS